MEPSRHARLGLCGRRGGGCSGAASTRAYVLRRPLTHAYARVADLLGGVRRLAGTAGLARATALRCRCAENRGGGFGKKPTPGDADVVLNAMGACSHPPPSCCEDGSCRLQSDEGMHAALTTAQRCSCVVLAGVVSELG